ncbi:MAG: restriction endonuclease [candidate division WOR-3 bacterium]|nr:restriction endonuclease [candidate division WOR-3 bacterium]
MALQLPQDLDARVRAAVRHFWDTRLTQALKQQKSGSVDQGARSAVTGGAQMNGFIDLCADLILTVGMPSDCLFRNSKLELPGFYRPTKKWDLLVVHRDQLVCAMEAKSQVGPSFSNNLNNRIEEAIGSAEDIWTAYRERVINANVRPWLGYLFLLEDCTKTQTPKKPKEPHFPVLAEFKHATYTERYALFCQKLVREGKYTVAAFMTSRNDQGRGGNYTEPAADLRFESFARSMANHVATFAP